MIRKRFHIDKIPAILWGEESNKVVIAVHGNMSNKEDVSIEQFSKYALIKGYQVLSFDLPEHGDRKTDNIPCKPPVCVRDLTSIMAYAKLKWEHISLFANSMGAYFSLLAYKDEPLEKVWFLSPLVDMQRLIKNMMLWFNVSEEQLEKEQIVNTPIGQTLYWDYFSYAKEHPITTWNAKTNILYGNKDEICEYDTILDFTERFQCKLKVIQEAEHYFHTEEQLRELDKWIKATL